ncbi:putative electron transport protein YccM [Phycisphaerae bacterium RAS1]|nr:putative electron transport protein YccM [Phycisphaerae bacterium RAS1]
MTRWRFGVLVAVHVGVALHVWHWLATGRTVTPLEPSESVQTLDDGLLNAGFILFAVAILSTFIFGRFFCGWGCHLIFLQDICSWVLKKCGIHPKPFRSRLLVFVPLGAALYMFVWPVVYRLLQSAGLPPLVYHFTTEDFWETFPGLWVSILSVVACGPLIVYFLGNKGFCTYACPYGGFFGFADQFAPGKIRVTEACEGCGHCTASCSSNVRVHEEVRTHGMVVDPGCMKCLDCVSVCPNDALYVGFGKPSVAAVALNVPKRARHFDFTWGQEALLAVVFLATLLIVRNLYDQIPFLLSLAIASMSAFVVVSAAQALAARNQRMFRVQIRRNGAWTRGGAVVMAGIGVWVLFLAHSAVVQICFVRGVALLSRARAHFEQSGGTLDAAATTDLRVGRQLMGTASRIGLLPVARMEGMLGAAHMLDGNLDAAAEQFRKSLSIQPTYAPSRYELSRLAAHAGDQETQIRELTRVLQDNPVFPGAAHDLQQALAALNRHDEAIAILGRAATRKSENAPLRLAYVLALVSAERIDDALREMDDLIHEQPRLPAGHYQRAAILADAERWSEAYSSARKALELNPDFAAAQFLAANAAVQTNRPAEALAHLEQCRRIEPYNPNFAQMWAAMVARQQQLAAAIEAAERAGDADIPAKYGLLYLYQAAGRQADAEALWRKLQSRATPPGSQRVGPR